MSHLVIARKYRPKGFADVVHQDHVVMTLQNAIRHKRVAHAYLFNGPRGVGKTSLARIFSRALNCEQGPTDTPCGVCSLCQEISQGTSMDVIEIDGASNNSVDNVRSLREGARFSPMKGRYKIYIIDEVHMLSTAAFNALLKILEEPPEHIVFLFATTEIHKIPPTILSRCQRFTFKRIPYEQITRNLEQILKQEGFAADAMALYWIAKMSGGSMRDAQSILEQLISFSDSGGSSENNKIQMEDVKNLLGVAGFDVYAQLLRDLRDDSPANLILHVQETLTSGVDSSRFIHGLLEFLRVLLLLSEKVEEPRILDLPAEEILEIKPLIKDFSAAEIHFMFQVFRGLPAEFRFVSDERIIIDMVLLRIYHELRQPNLSMLLTEAARLLQGGEWDDSVNTPAIPASRTTSLPAPQKRETNSVEKKSFSESMEMEKKTRLAEKARNEQKENKEIKVANTEQSIADTEFAQAKEKVVLDKASENVLEDLRSLFGGRVLTAEEQKRSKELRLSIKEQFTNNEE